MRTIAIPASVYVEVDDDFDIEDDEALAQAVLDQHGKYPELDFRTLGYDNAEDMGDSEF